MSDETKNEPTPETIPQGAPETPPETLPADGPGAEETGRVVKFPGKETGAENPETDRQRAQRLRDEALERENERLLKELKTGEIRELHRDGAGRISARKVLDEVTGAPVIVRFAEYGTNPFKPVYFLVDETRVEAMPVPGGAIVAVNGLPVFVPGAKVSEDGENPGYFRVM